MPEKLWVDQGSEFTGNAFKAGLEKMGIQMYHVYNEGKSVMAERMNRTIRSKLGVYQSQYGSMHWLRFLPYVMEAYKQHCA